MGSPFDSAKYANDMRQAASNEVHDDQIHEEAGGLFDLFRKLEPSNRAAVATQLEKGNSMFSSAPQAEISWHKGEVNCITFSAGNLDFGDNSRQITTCTMGGLMQAGLDQKAKH